MSFPKRSIYLILASIIIASVSTVMLLHAGYAYITTKNLLSERVQQSSKNSLFALEKNVANLMAAYSISEYETLINNQMMRRDIFAIIVKDYNMGKILGNDAYTSGVIRGQNGRATAYIQTNKEQQEALQNCYYSYKSDIVSPSGVALGSVTVYAANKVIEDELNQIILSTIINTLTISLLLIALLFIIIRHFIAKPISDIVENISNSDADGIPSRFSITSSSIEIVKLVDTINNMIGDIKESRTALKGQNEQLKNLVEEETTKRLEKEKLLLQHSKMAMMGQMIGAIAHQWRQPLNLLGINIQDAVMAYRLKQLNDEYMSEFKTSSMSTIQQMSKTIDDFRNFFKPIKDKIDFSVEQAIDDSLSIIGVQIKNHNIKLNFDKNNNHIIRGYQNELKQTILILISNAQDALMDKKIDEPSIGIFISEQNGKILIWIEDNAGGVPDEIIDRIFEPYFTTKEQGKGVGIGLYMAKEIVERQMGGKLSVENIEDRARFIIELEGEKA